MLPEPEAGESGRRGEPLAMLATAAVRDALDEAGLGGDGSSLDEVGLVMNTVLGPSTAIESYLEQLQLKGPRRARPALFVDALLSMPASRLGIEFQIRGSTAVLGGSSSLELALDWVRGGREHTVLAGGAEFQSPKCLRYHAALASRSGAERAGLGQGAAFVVLEAPERARARGVTPLGELLGAGAAGEPQEVSVPWSADPNCRALAVAMRSALADATLHAGAVGTVVLAAGDDASEEAELAALRDVFGDAAGGLRMLRPKRLFGETLGASAGIGLLAALAELEGRGELGVALVNAFEMGGAATSVLLRVAS